MTEDNHARASTDSSTTKQRKKRKWDVPAEPSMAAGLALPGTLPLVNLGSLAGVTVPSMTSMSNAPVATTLAANGPTLLPGFQASLLPQASMSNATVATNLVANSSTMLPGFQASLLPHAFVLAQKLNPLKVQDELIAREIFINDADSSIRYKLTKRQTQEEIQSCTGAVVITRGRYRPPNAPTDGEKPLYLHISAGSHLETTIERIKAVDSAAAMVEEILKQGSVNNGLKVNHLLSTCVYLGFEADPSLNIHTRIRGPNDQYINHIMNETGATVLLRGRGSGAESARDEEGPQAMHLLLSSNNLKSLEQAKLLAENLLDTISVECGASRVSSCKVYGAIPPPPQLMTEVQSPVNESKASDMQAASTTVSSMGFMSPFSSVTSPVLTGVVPQGVVSQSIGTSSFVQSQPTTSCYSHTPLSGGTSYNGYAGIYPQATPLQQVALALRQSASPVTATIGPVTTAPNTASHTSAGSSAKMEKRPPQKRKFQELPAAGKGPTSFQQGSNLQKPCELTSDVGARHVPVMPLVKSFVQPSSSRMMIPPPKNNLVQASANRMPPPPPKNMPPPPPKFNAPSPRTHENSNTPNIINSETVPDTLVKLMEYGDDDDDEESEEPKQESFERHSAARKPFWAL